MEQKSSAVHVLLAHIVTELAKRVSAKKMAQPDNTFSAPGNFETPLWATAKRTNSHAWLIPNINATNSNAHNSPEGVSTVAWHQ